MQRLIVLSVALGAVLLAPAAVAAIYAGPEDDPAFGVIAPELAIAMFPRDRKSVV